MEGTWRVSVTVAPDRLPHGVLRGFIHRPGSCFGQVSCNGFTLAYFEEPACVWEDGEKDRGVQHVRDVTVWNRAMQGRRGGSVVVLRKWMAFRVTHGLGKPFTSEPHPQLRRQSEGLRR